MKIPDASNSESGQGVRTRAAALILWPSFLAACFATVLFFAVVNPEMLRDAGPRLFANFDRQSGYALGFFFFWAMATMASGLSVWLQNSTRRNQRPVNAAGWRL